MNQLTTFTDIQYVRPDFAKIPLFYGELNARLQAAKSYKEVRQCIFDEEEFSSHINTMATVAQIRHTIDTSDKFYEVEDEYISQAYPEAMPYMQAFSLSLLSSPFKADIDKEFGEQFLKAVKLGVDSFSEKNVPLMQEESELTNKYQRLTAACKIPFDGGEHNLYGIMKYFSDPNPEVRKEAAKLYA
jgi:oligoendopeptidase F